MQYESPNKANKNSLNSSFNVTQFCIDSPVSNSNSQQLNNDNNNNFIESKLQNQGDFTQDFKVPKNKNSNSNNNNQNQFNNNLMFSHSNQTQSTLFNTGSANNSSQKNNDNRMMSLFNNSSQKKQNNNNKNQNKDFIPSSFLDNSYEKTPQNSQNIQYQENGFNSVNSNSYVNSNFQSSMEKFQHLQSSQQSQQSLDDMGYEKYQSSIMEIEFNNKAIEDDSCNNSILYTQYSQAKYSQDDSLTLPMLQRGKSQQFDIGYRIDEGICQLSEKELNRRNSEIQIQDEKNEQQQQPQIRKTNKNKFLQKKQITKRKQSELEPIREQTSERKNKPLQYYTDQLKFNQQSGQKEKIQGQSQYQEEELSFAEKFRLNQIQQISFKKDFKEQKEDKMSEEEDKESSPLQLLRFEKKHSQHHRKIILQDNGIKNIVQETQKVKRNTKRLSQKHVYYQKNCRFSRDFVIKQKIMKGKTTEVYECVNKLDGQTYAVKIIRLKSLDDTEQFLEEIKYFSQWSVEIESTFFVKTFSSWIEDDKLFIVLEHCNTTLRKIIYDKPNEFVLRRILQDVCSGLSIIHNKNCTHLALKPENIMMCNKQKYKFKIADLGLAKIQIQQNDTNHIWEGDYAYTAPEIVIENSGNQNQKVENLDKADIFSLGLIMYEFMTGTSLPKSGIEWEYLRKDKKKKNLSSVKYSKSFQKLVYDMIKQNPKDRISADQILIKLMIDDHAEDMEFNFYKKENKKHLQDIQDIEQQIRDLKKSNTKNSIIDDFQKLNKSF